MKQQTIRILAVSSFIVFLHSGCSTAPSREEPNKAPAVVKELAKSTRSWDGEMLPAYPAGQPKVTILRISIPAGTELDLHRHPVINAGVLISGQLTVQTKRRKNAAVEGG